MVYFRQKADSILTGILTQRQLPILLNSILLGRES